MARQSVVVIDDDAITLQLICDALESQLKINVYAFNHSKLAREFLRQQHDSTISLIISDQMMPDYDGLHLLELWRERGMQSPFLLLTAEATRATVVKARAVGVTQFIAKPFHTETLIAKIRSLLAP